MNFFKQLIRTLSHPTVEEASTIKSECLVNSSKLIRAVGKEGNGIGQFKNPGGIVITEEGHAVIADTGNNRIQIMSIDGEILNYFGTAGPDILNINSPADVAISPEGNILLTDTKQACVKIFTSQGQFLSSIPSISNGMSISSSVSFIEPHGIAVTQNGYVLVSDVGNHTISILMPSGQLRNRFGGGPGDQNNQLNKPFFLAVTKDRRVIVSDWGNACVKVFTFGGIPVHQFTAHDFRLKVPRIDGPTCMSEVPELWLGGLCLDSEENVLLVVNDKVCLLQLEPGDTSDGCCRIHDGHLCQIFGELISPIALAYASNGRLVITEGSFPHDTCEEKHKLFQQNHNLKATVNCNHHIVMYRYNASYYKVTPNSTHNNERLYADEHVKRKKSFCSE